RDQPHGARLTKRPGAQPDFHHGLFNQRGQARHHGRRLCAGLCRRAGAAVGGTGRDRDGAADAGARAGGHGRQPDRGRARAVCAAPAAGGADRAAAAGEQCQQPRRHARRDLARGLAGRVGRVGPVRGLVGVVAGRVVARARVGRAQPGAGRPVAAGRARATGGARRDARGAHARAHADGGAERPVVYLRPRPGFLGDIYIYVHVLCARSLPKTKERL
ncbi:uncharacterized protein V1510DRAFT_427804, partial [Dipodascopsis tothii]|uniref:uncharacterized protein n=1 Tax=Dipodascopsis tothii TaxID=44089 RepID=UPI0034D00A70